MEGSDEVALTVTLEACISEVLRLKLGRDMGQLDSGFSWFSAVFPSGCWPYLDKTTATLLQILSTLSVILLFGPDKPETIEW
jgi:hypothetical protein